MSPRYIVSGPVPGGDQWYRIADTQSPHYPNFAVAQFSPDLDFAQREADELCRRLNKGENRRKSIGIDRDCVAPESAER